MELAPGEMNVDRSQLRFQGAGHFLESIAQRFDHRQDRSRQLLGRLPLHFHPLAAGRRTDAQLDLVKPQSQVGEQ